MKFCLSVLSTLLLFCSFVTGTVVEPEAYFGGIDHDGYLDWYDEIGDDKYGSSTFLAASDTSTLGGEEINGVAIHWKIIDSHIELAVAARATGWLGFGLAEAGGMEGM